MTQPVLKTTCGMDQETQYGVAMSSMTVYRLIPEVVIGALAQGIGRIYFLVPL